MNPLQQASVNSGRLISERLAQLDRELELLGGKLPDSDNQNRITGKMTVEVPGERYTVLPKLELPLPKKSSLKPQITAEYTQTLQHAPELMTLYDRAAHEPEFLSEARDLRLPPRVSVCPSLLSEFLDEVTEQRDPFQ